MKTIHSLVIVNSLFLFLSTAQASPEESVQVWQTYFPNVDCSKNECASKVPTPALEALLEKGHYYYPQKLETNNWIFVSDFTQHSSKKRGYLINTKTGNSTAYYVAHGVGSDDGNGNAVRFSNIEDSKMSSPGLYLTAETYSGSHGYSLKLDGIESTNSNARDRYIVLHGADYVNDRYVRDNGRAGRSWGCPAVDQKLSKDLIDKLKEGSLYYIYTSA